MVLYSQYIVHVDSAEHAILNTQRWASIFPLRAKPCRRKRSAPAATALSTQYVIKAGPGPNCIRTRMTKTSPIEISDESLGNLTFIVATKREITVKRSHSREKLFFVLRQ